MQMGVLTGLVHKFRGASKYLEERKNPLEASRIIVCRVTYKEELVHAPLIKKSVIQRLPFDGTVKATLVVVGITYGAEAYCILSHKLDEIDDQDARDEADEYLSEISRKMKNSLDEGQSVTEFWEQFEEEEQKKLGRLLKCRMYADFHSTRHCNVFDAYKCCSLISLANVTDNGIPISYKVCALDVIINQPGLGKLFTLCAIDLTLLSRCHFIWDQLEWIIAQVEIIRRDADNSSKRCLRHFQKAVVAYQGFVRESYKNGLIVARQTGNSEELVKAVKITENHPDFKPSTLNNWIQHKRMEMNLVKKMKSIDGVTYLEDRDLLNKTLADCFEKKHSLVLTVPSFADKTDTVLGAMETYIKSCGNSLVDLKEVFPQKERFPIPVVAEWTRKEFSAKIRELTHFAKMNKDLKDKVQFFVVSSTPGSKFTFSYSVFEDDELTTEDHRVQLPYAPTELRVITSIRMCDKSLDSVLVVWKYGNLHYPFHFLVEYRVKGTSEKAWNRQVTKPLVTQTTVSFKKGSAMEFRVAAVTCIGRSEFSDIIEAKLENPSGEDESRFAKKA